MKKITSIMRRTLGAAVPDVCYIAGCSCMVYAAHLVCTALAFALAGVLMVITGFLLAGGGDGDAG